MNLKNGYIRKNIRQFPHLGKLLSCTLLLSPIRAGSKTASRETGRNPYRSIRPKHEQDHLTTLVQIVKLNGKNLKLHP